MTPAERKAVAFLAAVAALGAGARAAGLGGAPPPIPAGDPADDERRALDRQLAAVDSARADRHARARARRRTGRPPSVRPVTPTGSDAGDPPAPPLTPPEPAADTRTRTTPPAAPVDVDRADSAALDALPGIGPALARRIVADRVAHGAFGSIGGLSRVSGIGPRLEGRLRPLVTFSGAPSAAPPR